MFTQQILICFSLLILTARTLAQCSAPGSLLCSASSAAADAVNADLDATEVDDGLAELDGAAGVGIDSEEKLRFLRRQGEGSSSLCCSPEQVCLAITEIPYCYNALTTEFTFANGSYGFLSNESFYSADGTNLLNSNGDASMASPAVSATIPTSPLASSSNLGTISTEATPTDVASASHTLLATGTSAGKGAMSEGQLTPSAPSSITSASSTSSAAGLTTSSNAAYQVGRQNTAAAAGFSVAWILWIFP